MAWSLGTMLDWLSGAVVDVDGVDVVSYSVARLWTAPVAIAVAVFRFVDIPPTPCAGSGDD